MVKYTKRSDNLSFRAGVCVLIGGLSLGACGTQFGTTAHLQPGLTAYANASTGMSTYVSRTLEGERTRQRTWRLVRRFDRGTGVAPIGDGAPALNVGPSTTTYANEFVSEFLCDAVDDFYSQLQHSGRIASYANAIRLVADESPDTIVGLASALANDYDAWLTPRTPGEGYLSDEERRVNCAAPSDAPDNAGVSQARMAAICARRAEERRISERYDLGDPNVNPDNVDMAVMEAVVQCRDDIDAALNGSYINDPRFEPESTFVRAGLGIVDVFVEFIRPIIIDGLRIVDRTNRARALEAFFRENDERLVEMRAGLDALREWAVNANARARLSAARDYVVAYEAFADHAESLNLASVYREPDADFEPEDSYAYSFIRDGRREAFAANRRAANALVNSAQFKALQRSSDAYDAALDADPRAAFDNLNLAICRLIVVSDNSSRRPDDCSSAPPNVDDEIAATRASIDALMAVAQLVARFETLADDRATRDRFDEALDELREALGND